ncbi:PA2779 family protein [uncultured Desulfosarcina sp.]|uniref:PA2779 family protein n=1 Tax=uncultured Desulfosarcina sp. TaxID=218289 RepID=UPI0029C6907E|nr:PA2779 family protein [uncultured Desulfosarcina sp.]
MRKVRKALKPVSLFMAIFMLVLCTPCQTVLAKMIPTATLLDAARVEAARTQVSTFMARQDVVDVLVSQGIDPTEATARIAGLSDAEVVRLADRIEQLPAGGDTFGAILIASVVVFVILLITDILGYTDIFPFVKKKRI